MRAWRCSAVVFWFACFALLVCGSARAQEGHSAAELKNSGNEKMVDSDFVGAIDDYEKALALTPDDLALYYNLGRAHGLLGHYPESLAALETFASRATPELRAKIANFDTLLAEARQRVGFLSVTCNVPSARVQVDSRVVGTAPFARIAVKAGQATIKIDAEGYLDDVRAVSIAGAKELTLDCRLLARSTSGTLLVSANPAGARIAVDDTFRGNGRVELPLPAGAHAVGVALDGYEPTTTTVVVTANGLKTVDLTLPRKPVPITSRWWFWGGVAVVVAGGVALSIAALTEKSPGNGSIQPHQIGTPLRF